MRRSPDEEDYVWQRLWEMRDLAPVRGMLPLAVSSPCPLLGDEAADTLLAINGAVVPGETAWVTSKIDIVEFATADGDVRMQALEQALERSVDSGDVEHELRAWTTHVLGRDSRLNRRLAVWVRGWGTVAALRGADPCNLATLRDLQQLAAHVRAVLEERSRRLAQERGYCPAIDIAGARVLQHGEEMNARWRSAVGRNALRHRNLLMLSPWDVFPSGAAADLRYADLVPLLGCADTVSFHRDVDISHWNAVEFKSFHERVGAELQRRNEFPLIAKQV